MTQYIDKDALVAEIKKIKSYIGSDKYLSDFEKGCNFGREDVCDSLLNFIDTLEVKEVDLDGEIALWANAIPEIRLDDVERLAKYFFELGLKAQSKDMIEALRTEYEKGRADVIADTLSWLANVWPQYCSNPNIIDAYKEGVVKE
jgi:hypothetical protein